MKLVKFMTTALIFGIIFNLSSVAQEPASNSFFPFSVGNIWEYDQGFYLTDKLDFPNSIENKFDLDKTNEIVRYEIFRDSIGNNGQIYLFYEVGIFDPLWSIDTSSSIVYYIPERLNWEYYLLNADTGDSWMVVYEDSSSGRQGRRALLNKKYPATVFGVSTELIEIEYYELNWGDTVINQYSIKINTETLASGFGLLSSIYEEPGSFNMLLQGCVIDGDTFGIISSVKDVNKFPDDFYLSQNFPNPFNPLTKITYSLDSRKFITMKVYDLLGREVATLVEAEKPAGVYEAIFDGDNLASGVYVYRLSTNNGSVSKKMILIK
ncbi:MAG TPA: T9SS type A sorting domain-containing protein [Ignavibacteriaceae bacterium]|nr:T9SS type A sorting domain-containing protein [Ignavibacteriaceae bacterium]